MKPVLLCMLNNECSKELEGFNKTYFDNTDYTYTSIGLGKELLLNKDITNNKILLSKIKKSKNVNIHIIGDINKDKDNLKNILDLCKDNSIYMHLFSNEKPNVKKLNKELKIGKIVNTIHDELIEKDINRVYNIIIEGKDSKNITITNNDLIIFFNDDLGFISKFIDVIIDKKYNNILTIYPYKNTISMNKVNDKSISDSLNELGIKVLEDINISYVLDGYKRNKYKNISYSYSVFNENIEDYDIVITEIKNDDFDRIEKYDNSVILIAKENGKLVLLLKNIDLTVSDINKLSSELIKFFKVKVNIFGVIFRIISVLFIISCVVYYMTRFLHFYIME